MKKQKRLAALLLSMVMVVSAFPGAVTQAVDSENASQPEVVAEYDMSHDGEYLKDISGNGNDAKMVGFTDADFETDGDSTSLVFSGDSGKYVELPAGLIEEEEFSIEATFKTEVEENAWLFCLGSKVNVWPNVKNYVFFCPAQGNNGNGKEGNIRAGIKDASTEILLAQDQAINMGEYNTVKYEFSQGKITVSLNGAEVESKETGYSIQEILKAGTDESTSGYIGKSLYSPDPAFRGSLQHFTVTAVKKDQSDEAKVEEAKEQLTLPYNTEDKPVYGNITLPETTENGVEVTWETSEPEIVDVEAHENEDYDATPAGTVTRPEKDTDVKMTATLKSGTVTAQKEFTFTVKKAVEKLSEDDYEGYFFTYFAGEGYANGEQIYFAASEDGLNWKDLNANEPVLTSTLGECGVRDPFIIRSPEGDKFYMIATDLKINGGNGWTAAQQNGSQSLMVWESEDLVNWSEQRMVEVSASIEAGCTWAPEATYDPVTGEYVVYWASKTANDNYGKQRLYYAKTRDFYTFTEPKVYIDKDQSSIDTTIIYDEASETYYRYTKNEGGNTNELGAKTKSIFIEKSSSVLGEWTQIASDSLNQNQWVEGPTIFKFNKDDAENGSHCLLVDNFGGGGYYPLVTDNLETGEFSKPSTTYKMPSRARHGTPIRVTKAEYEALMEKWDKTVEENTDPEEQDPILEYDFESADGQTVTDVSGNGNDAVLNGNAAISQDAEKGNVLHLDGTDGTFAELPQGFFDGRNKFTVSMDVKAEKVSGNFFTFAIGQNSEKYLFLKTNADSLKSVITTGSWKTEQGFNQNVDSEIQNQWLHLTLVMEKGNMKLYLDDKLIGEKDDVSVAMTDLGENLQSFLGKSFYDADGYFQGSFDNFKVYNRALSEEEITGEEPEEPHENVLLLHYDFQNVEDGIVKDVSGYGNDGVIKGEGAVTADGVLTLPGGAASSDAAYVELPQGMFDGYDTLTISTWLKNETGAGNYAAMFFGTTESLPTGYWLLNPCNPAGQFKSVITNEKRTDAPYQTEVGFSPTNANMGIAGPKTGTDWGLYTTVIQEDSITAYYNGQKLGTVAANRTVSEFGKNLVAYIGRSSYADKFYKGSVKEVKVYTKAVSDYEVTEEYYAGMGEEAVLNALNEDAEMLILPYDKVISDISLPTEGKNGSQVTWESSDTAHLTGEGKVNRPAKGEGNAEVVLTATLTIGEKSVTKDFTITVLEDSPENDLEMMMKEFELAESYVTEDMVLPTELEEGTEITWTSSAEEVLSAEGKVNRPAAGTGDAEVTLKAVVAYEGITAEKEFKVTVVEETYGYLLTYVREGDTDRTDALHIGYSKDGKEFTALNNNRPVLYTTKGAKKLGAPYVFRKVDGTYGLIATDNQNSDSVILYDSEDLIHFTNERTVKLNRDGIKVSDAECTYDYKEHTYRINWKGNDGKAYTMLTTDFEIFTDAKETEYVKSSVDGALPEQAVEESVFEMTKAEYEKILNKYSRLENTGVTDFEDIVVEKGTELSEIELPETLTAKYNDGSSKNFNVAWEEESLANVDTNTAGTYSVEGTVSYTEYPDVLVEERADPFVTKADDGYYYFTASYPVRGSGDREGYDRIILRRAKTLTGLADAEEVVIWDEKDSEKASPYIWAPEIHNINGCWYILFTASRGNSVWNIRPHMLKCVNNEDIMNPESWKTADESNLHQVEACATDTFSFRHFSLDMTYFESNGVHYVAWAEKPTGLSNIYLATIDPNEPWKLTSDAVMVTTPDYAWEWSGNTTINEGPAVLKHDGKIFLCFSAAAVDDTYCVSMLSADEGADLMNLDSWTKHPYPLLTSDDFSDQYGPGHNSFTVDENGNPVIVYHARPRDCDSAEGSCGFVGGNKNDALRDPCRHARVKGLNFAADGTPVLNMTAEEELKESYRKVSVNIVVTEEAPEYVDITYTAGEGGHIEGEAAQRILKGNDAAAVTATADDGYRFVQWSDGVMTAERTDLTVSESFTVEAMFEYCTQPAETDKTELGGLLETAGKVNGKDYTDDSYQNFESAYQEAKEVYADSDASQNEIDKAVENLKKAVAELKKAGDGEVVKPGTGSGVSGGSEAVRTGDTAVLSVWYVLMIGAAIAAVLMTGRKKKNKN